MYIATKIQTYLPAVLRCSPSMGIFAEYYVFDSQTEKMVRKRVKLTRAVKNYRTKHQRMLAAQTIVDNLNRKLSGGWSPLYETSDGRLYTPIAELRDKFLSAKQREGCRDTTLRDYRSITNIFLGWCEDTGRARKHSGTFLRPDAVQYMDFVLEKGNTNRHYNNTSKVMRCFFQWALEHCYCKENPFAGIKPLPKQPKRRTLIDKQHRTQIARYFRAECPQMLLLCKLVYNSAVRPIEAAQIRIADIDLTRHCITIPPEVAKNKHQRNATITADMCRYLGEIVATHLPDEYLFGTGKQMMPGTKHVTFNYFRKKWDTMRKELGLPAEMQLYSLRDTGLTDLLHSGVDQLTVQHHADHSSLAIQNIYTDHFDPLLNEKIYNNAPEF